MMQLSVTSKPDGQWVSVPGARLDAAVATTFKDSMRRILTEGAGPVVLDLSEVMFMDSSGLGAVIAVLKSMPDGRDLRLYGLTSNVMRVFRLTHMDSVFTIMDGTPPEPETGQAQGAP